MPDKSKRNYTKLGELDQPLTLKNANDVRNKIFDELAEAVKEERTLLDKKMEAHKLWVKGIKKHKELERKMVEFYDKLKLLMEAQDGGKGRKKI